MTDLNTNTHTTTTTVETTGTTLNSNYCGSRLPCGICRLTMSSCPLVAAREPIITFTSLNTGIVEDAAQATIRGTTV